MTAPTLPSEPATIPPDPTLEARARDYIMERLTLAHTPAHLRLAFHDAGAYDVATRTGGADGGIHFPEEMTREENAGWSDACIELLAQVKERHPELSWADLVALGGAAAVAKCGGPVIEIGLGRRDATEPAPEHRLPTTDEGAEQLKADFQRMGLTARDLVALAGAHTLGGALGQPFVHDPFVFSNTYYQALVAPERDPSLGLLASDWALMDDAELRPYVELYARDQARFFEDFADAYRRLTWLGATDNRAIPEAEAWG